MQNSASDLMDTDNSTPSPTKGRRIFEIFSWENTQSNLTNNRPSSTRIPPATDPTSAFLDVQRVPNEIDGLAIAQALPEEAIGSKFRADTNFIQIFFDTTEDANKFIEQGTLPVKEHDIPIIPPKGKLPPTAYIRLDNVPIRKRDTMEGMLRNALAEFCLPVEVAPITLKGTRLLTTRWELLAKAIPEQNLAQSLPPIIEVDGQKVLLSWPGSPLTCLQCLAVGHNRKNCPKRTKTAPASKQGPTPKQKNASANKKASYAAVVTQLAPEHNTNTETLPPESLEIEYQGPTSVYDIGHASSSKSQISHPTTPIRGSTPVLPDYEMDEPHSENQEFLNSQPLRKRSHEASPTPLPKNSIYNYITKQMRREQTDPMNQGN